MVNTNCAPACGRKSKCGRTSFVLSRSYLRRLDNGEPAIRLVRPTRAGVRPARYLDRGGKFDCGQRGMPAPVSTRRSTALTSSIPRWRFSRWLPSLAPFRLTAADRGDAPVAHTDRPAARIGSGRAGENSGGIADQQRGHGSPPVCCGGPPALHAGRQLERFWPYI
jgi:hypothetical protein